MAVRLISKTEKLKYTHEASASGFYYHRPTVQVQREIQAKHTVKGVVDQEAFLTELIAWAVTGWWGFIDESGNEVGYSSEYLMDGSVPELYKAGFIAELYAFNPEVAEVKNSNAS